MFDIEDGVLIGACLTENDKVVEIPDGVVVIAQGAFDRCYNLEKVIIKEGVKSIGEGAFYDCVKLKKVVFPKSLTCIERGAFYSCESLDDIELYDNVSFIGEEAFSGCKNLKSIRLSKGITSISSGAFSMCKSLRKIDIPKGVTLIGSSAFDSCENLKEIVIGENVEEIERGVFEDCVSLQNVRILSPKLKVCENIFRRCEYIDKISIKDIFCEFSGTMASFFDRFNFIYKGDDGYLFSSREVEESNLKKINIDGVKGEVDCDNLTAVCLKGYFDEKEIEKLGVMKFLLKHIVKDKFLFEDRKMYTCLFNNSRFNLLLKKCEKINGKDCKENSLMYYGLFKFAYSIGAFSDDDIESQRACEVIANYIDKYYITNSFMLQVLNKMELRPYDKEWVDFVMSRDQRINNFEELVKASKINGDFISNVYKSFECIKDFGRSNKGKQKQRKVTIKMCKDYLCENKFLNVNSKNKDIADEIGKFTKKQDSFDRAVEIRRKYLEQGVSEHLLGENLKEIDELRKMVNLDARETIGCLSDISKIKFTYEYLSKYDPRNFVLGKYCSCCAHLEAAGFGVMKASILHPDLQNLVILDENGRIVAKSTIYVNRNQGYALFNTFEMDIKYKNTRYENKIYNAFIRGIKRFVEKYNDGHDVPITRVNVGAASNFLEDILEERCVKTGDILEGVHFSEYGITEKRYDGDWEKEGQYIILDMEEKSKVK